VPSKRHQRILGMLLRAARERGYTVESLDGAIARTPLEAMLPQTPQIGRHRPDAVCRDSSGRAAVCEAKTAYDLASPRTVEQLEDFSATWDRGEYALVLFGFPRSADALARQKAKTAGVLQSPNLILVAVPDEVLDA